MADIRTSNVAISGMADLERALLGLSDRLAKNVMFGAMRAGAVVIQRAAKEKCPVSAEAHWLGKKGSKSRILVKPGELKKKGIRVKRLKRGQGATSIAVAAYVSSRYWYGKFVEYGHAIVGKKRTRAQRKAGTGASGHVPANPFMRPAWDENKERALAAAGKYLAERIPREIANVR